MLYLFAKNMQPESFESFENGVIFGLMAVCKKILINFKNKIIGK